MNALKLAAILAIGVAASDALSAAPAPPACSAAACTADAAACTANAGCCAIPARTADATACPTADCPATCTGPGSACCEEMGCCEESFKALADRCKDQLRSREFVAALATAKRVRTLFPDDSAAKLMVWKAKLAPRKAACEEIANSPMVSYVPCSPPKCGTALACNAPPAPATATVATCGEATPSTAVVVCSASSADTPPSPKRLTACNGDACPLSVCGSTTVSKAFITAVSAPECPSVCGSEGPSVCGTGCLAACGTACRGPECDGGPCPDGVTGALAREISPCKTQCESGDAGALAEWHATASLAAPYPIAYEPPGLYGGQTYGVVRTAAVSPAPSISSASYAVPVEANPGLPVGRWTRTLNDQSVTIAVAADGSFAAVCTVPNAGCSLKVTGDCRATADGLLFGVVTSAKACPSESNTDSVDPVACVEIETFCRSLIDQPFSARCRVSGQSMTVSHTLFGGIGFVGTPGPGEPAHLALTMFSGAYEAE
ncbi:hypothetical protein [Alienimonas chondri]|uniref:IGFBP N-terminal domain-containing protein n=1 Tax=Alienimonas chondri TaxID=2681879 RepID=A0ABX1VAJ5_9PLAN|nr:hypothetical protein [Alienimonas chondri]NNJ25119.1 hypothetical protein [Alienimonas chondri]